MAEFNDIITRLADSRLSNEFLRRPSVRLIARYAAGAEPALATTAMVNAAPFASGKALEAILGNWPDKNTRLALKDSASARENARAATLTNCMAEVGFRQYIKVAELELHRQGAAMFPAITSDLMTFAWHFKRPDFPNLQVAVVSAWRGFSNSLIRTYNEPNKATVIDTAFRLHEESDEMTGIAADFLLANIGRLRGEHAAKREPLYRDASFVADRKRNGRGPRFAAFWGFEVEKVRAAQPAQSDAYVLLCADAIRLCGESSSVGTVAASKTDMRLVAVLGPDNRDQGKWMLVHKSQLKDKYSYSSRSSRSDLTPSNDRPPPFNRPPRLPRLS